MKYMLNFLTLLFLILFLVIQGCTPSVPGVVIDYIPAESGKYVGSPSIAVIPNGDYIASHDVFGPESKYKITRVFRSKDKGENWEHLTDLENQWWSNLFVHKGDLYIMGPSKRFGKVVIRKSTDGGESWTNPQDENTGLLTKTDGYHTAPVPILVYNGRIWRSMEYTQSEDNHLPREKWLSLVMSAPVDADFLKAENWTMSEMIWHNNPPQRWIEGNVIKTPENKLVNILRLNGLGAGKAAVVRILDSLNLSYNPEEDNIDFIGGGAKFTIRYDSLSGRYWSLVNKQKDPPNYRNILALTSSSDLKNWRIEKILLEHPDKEHHAFQYIDWLFEKNDIIAVSRTAWEGSHRAHDANYMTFHRFKNFRE